MHDLRPFAFWQSRDRASHEKCSGCERPAEWSVLPEDVLVQAVFSNQDGLTIRLICTSAFAHCPHCRTASERLHGQYGRATLADLSCAGRRVVLALIDTWLLQAEQCGLPEFKSFAKGIRQEEKAVKATFSSLWPNGQVEGQVNRLKFQKRMGYGRANFDLLRMRVLASAEARMAL